MNYEVLAEMDRLKMEGQRDKAMEVAMSFLEELQLKGFTSKRVTLEPAKEYRHGGAAVPTSAPIDLNTDGYPNYPDRQRNIEMQ